LNSVECRGFRSTVSTLYFSICYSFMLQIVSSGGLANGLIGNPPEFASGGQPSQDCILVAVSAQDNASSVAFTGAAAHQQPACQTIRIVFASAQGRRENSRLPCMPRRPAELRADRVARGVFGDLGGAADRNVLRTARDTVADHQCVTSAEVKGRIEGYRYDARCSHRQTCPAGIGGDKEN
jgi:hypothetical protein